MVGGALCSVHLNRFDAWLRRNTLRVGVGGLAVTTLTTCVYYGYTYTGELPQVSRAATNPLSLRAFGLFVVHPLVIDLIHKSGFVHRLYEMFPRLDRASRYRYRPGPWW